jgi:hypothetical protein
LNKKTTPNAQRNKKYLNKKKINPLIEVRNLKIFL